MGATFPLFHKLPPEIQDQIWRIALLESIPLVVSITIYEAYRNSRLVYLTSKLPPIFHASRSSRREALRVASLWHRLFPLETGGAPIWMYFDPEMQPLEMRLDDSIFVHSFNTGHDEIVVDMQRNLRLLNEDLVMRVQHLHICHGRAQHWLSLEHLTADLEQFSALKVVTISPDQIHNLVAEGARYKVPVRCMRPNISHLERPMSDFGQSDLFNFCDRFLRRPHNFEPWGTGWRLRVRGLDAQLGKSLEAGIPGTKYDEVGWNVRISRWIFTVPANAWSKDWLYKSSTLGFELVEDEYGRKTLGLLTPESFRSQGSEDGGSKFVDRADEVSIAFERSD